MGKQIREDCPRTCGLCEELDRYLYKASYNTWRVEIPPSKGETCSFVSYRPPAPIPTATSPTTSRSIFITASFFFWVPCLFVFLFLFFFFFFSLLYSAVSKGQRVDRRATHLAANFVPTFVSIITMAAASTLPMPRIQRIQATGTAVVVAVGMLPKCFCTLQKGRSVLSLSEVEAKILGVTLRAIPAPTQATS